MTSYDKQAWIERCRAAKEEADNSREELLRQFNLARSSRVKEALRLQAEVLREDRDGWSKRLRTAEQTL